MLPPTHILDCTYRAIQELQETENYIAKGKTMKTSYCNPKLQDVVVVTVCVVVLICTVGAVAQRTQEHSHQLTCYAQMMTLLDGFEDYDYMRSVYEFDVNRRVDEPISPGTG